MRRTILILAAASLPLLDAPAQAQQYPWCTYYTGGRDGGGTNCGFVSCRPAAPHAPPQIRPRRTRSVLTALRRRLCRRAA